MTCGPDGIPVAIIKKKVKHQIAEPLSHIINRSLDLGKCPENMKNTKTIGIQKGQKSYGLNDLRPLAITSVFSKVFETAHCNGMSNYLHQTNFFTPTWVHLRTMS